jgi:hypothetical protein
MIGERSQMSNIFELDDNKLIEKFVQGSDRLLASEQLRIEVTGGVSQLMTRNGDTIAMMYLQNKPRSIIVKKTSTFAEIIDRIAIELDFVMFGDASREGFTEYKHYVTPAGYRIWYTDPSILWKKWWPTERFQNKQRFNMDILVNFKGSWYPVQNITVNAGTFTIKTIAGQLVLQRASNVLWLAQIMQENSTVLTATNTEVEFIPAVSEKNSATIADFNSQLSSANLAKKIQQKQSTIDAAQAWKIIKELEHKLQNQIKLATELEEKYVLAEQRATIAEQRLQMVHQHLHQVGIDPRDIYTQQISTSN